MTELSKLSKYLKQPEDIKRLETNRSPKENHIFECSANEVETKIPNSQKSKNSTESEKNTKKKF